MFKERCHLFLVIVEICYTVEALRPEVRAIAHELIDAMLAQPQPADFVESVALALPTRVISALLGVPYEDRDLFHEFEAAVMSLDPAESARGAREDERRRLVECAVWRAKLPEMRYEAAVEERLKELMRI